MPSVCVHACCLVFITAVLMVNIVIVSVPCLMSFSISVNLTEIQAIFSKSAMMENGGVNSLAGKLPPVKRDSGPNDPHGPPSGNGLPNLESLKGIDLQKLLQSQQGHGQMGMMNLFNQGQQLMKSAVTFSMGVWHIQFEMGPEENRMTYKYKYAELGNKVATSFESMDAMLKVVAVPFPFDLKKLGQAMGDIVSKTMIVLQVETTLAAIFASVSVVLAACNMLKCHGFYRQSHFILAVSQLLTGVLLFFPLFNMLHMTSQMKDLQVMYDMMGMHMEDVSCHFWIYVGYIAVVASITMFFLQSWMMMAIKSAKENSGHSDIKYSKLDSMLKDENDI